MINKFISKHGNKFDYSKVNYINNNTNIEIICKKHGNFFMRPKVHLRSNTGCVKCSNDLKSLKNRISYEEFVKRANKIWKNKYDYSKVYYVNSHTPITIILNGVEYRQLPYSHLCGKSPEKKSVKKSNEDFIQQCIKKHHNKYDYSITEYKSSDDFIEFIYNGETFRQRAVDHLRGFQPDRRSTLESNKITLVKFIEITNSKFGKFTYPNIKNELKNLLSTITIVCEKHGVFKQKIINHINSKTGCSNCVDDLSKGEKIIANYLEINKVKYFNEYRFLNTKISNLRFDFYLKELNVCIEFDGIQHFESFEYFGGIEKYNKLKINDNKKTNFCQENKIKLIRIPYWDMNKIEKILKNALNL